MFTYGGGGAANSGHFSNKNMMLGGTNFGQGNIVVGSATMGPTSQTGTGQAGGGSASQDLNIPIMARMQSAFVLSKMT